LVEIAVGDLARRVVVPVTDDPLRLILEVDGAAVWEQAFKPCDLAVARVSPVFARVPIAAGPHHLALRLLSVDGLYELRLRETALTVAGDQIVPLRPDDRPSPDYWRQ
jgi:hypothetical protein